MVKCMVRVARLWSRKLPEGCEFKAGVLSENLKTLSVNPAVNGHLFQIREG